MTASTSVDREAFLNHWEQQMMDAAREGRSIVRVFRSAPDDAQKALCARELARLKAVMAKCPRVRWNGCCTATAE